MAMKRLIKQYLFRCREAQIQNVESGRAFSICGGIALELN